MFGFSKLAIVAAAFGAANAFITGIKPFEAGYLFQTASDPAANASTLPIVFTTGSTKVSFYDLSIAFGITKSSSLASNTTFGTPLNYTVDLVALGFSDTGPGEFTIDVPVKADQLPEGENDCAYVIVAAVTRAVGSLPDLTFRADQLIVPFNATTT